MIIKVLLFFQLLYIVNQVHFPWETGIPGVAPANILFVAILLMLRGKADFLPAQPPKLKNAFLYFFGALAFSFLWAQVRAAGDLIADLTYLKNAIFFPLLYFLYLRCKQDEKTTRWLIIWVLVVAAVAGLEAFREGIDYGFGQFNPTRRASGPFGVDFRMSNRAGVFFGMFMPMFVSLALFLRKRKLWRLAALTGIFLLAGGVVSTYSRQSYFMVLLSTTLLLLRRNIVYALVLGGTLVALAGYLPDSVFQRVEETKQQGAHGEDEVDVSTASRWEIWEGASHMLGANPIGVGLNRFQREIGSYSSHKNMDAHNFYVLTTAECGPQGLALFLFLIWNLFRLASFVRKSVAPDDSETRALALGFTMTTVCFAIAGFYGSPHFEGAVMGPYWALAGLLERYVGLKMTTSSASNAASSKTPSLTERFPLFRLSEPGRRERPEAVPRPRRR